MVHRVVHRIMYVCMYACMFTLDSAHVKYQAQLKGESQGMGTREMLLISFPAAVACETTTGMSDVKAPFDLWVEVKMYRA